MKHYSVTSARSEDFSELVNLYQTVAAEEGGLARTQAEISDSYVSHFLRKSLESGVILVARAAETQTLLGEIHCYALGPQVFSHVLGELTIAVHPASQGQGVGKALFTELLRQVQENRPDILRVELIARESNHKAIEFYQKLGFHREGRMVSRIRSVDGGFEADIPMAWYRT
ncbi:MAG: GNAT family N-acetyltransferase [Blastocatellia bacterium]|nr:GNAT family N-acetyltransferase [Blastocatellia bacterium]